MIRRFTPFALATLFAAFTAGCPQQDGESDGPVDTCTSAGQKCRLAPGQLGVCTMKVEGGYQCLSQH